MKNGGFGLLLVLAAGCQGGETQASWAQSWGLRWNLLNHRVGQILLQARSDGGADAAFIGGASTTKCVYSGDAGCVPLGVGGIEEPTCYDPKTCYELPALDTSTAWVNVVTTTTQDGALATGAMTLTTRGGEASGEALIALPSRTSAREASAWIASWGMSASVNIPDGTQEGCYDPRNGWLPEHVFIGLGDPVQERDGKLWSVPVQVSFQAGLSYESSRACLDAAQPAAEVAFHVQIVLAVGHEARVIEVEQGAVWEDKSMPQSLEDIGSIEAPGVSKLSGWRSLEWTFHQQVEKGRGAYLRSLAVMVDPDAGTAYGLATNKSQGTQLSGFDYAFHGEMVIPQGFEGSMTTVAGYGLDAMPASLAADGAAVVQKLLPMPDAPSFAQ